MIGTVDDALRRTVREVLPDEAVTVTFEAPTRDWAARRSGPAVDLYLYDVHEDVGRRLAGRLPVREAGRLTGERTPQRWYALSYLLTCWTSRPEDEHALLSTCLVGLLRYEVLPPAWLGPGVDPEQPCRLDVAQPPPAERRSPDLWSALGRQLKPSLDLTVTVALDVGTVRPVGPLVVEPPVLVAAGLSPAEGRKETRAHRRPAPA
ncbi:MAG: hypothetical protein JWO60_3331 [Frankiales bacterium]|nr:hypothetical protein [Frankiales bacterium]